MNESEDIFVYTIIVVIIVIAITFLAIYLTVLQTQAEIALMTASPWLFFGLMVLRAFCEVVKTERN